MFAGVVVVVDVVACDSHLARLQVVQNLLTGASAHPELIRVELVLLAFGGEAGNRLVELPRNGLACRDERQPLFGAGTHQQDVERPLFTLWARVWRLELGVAQAGLSDDILERDEVGHPDNVPSNVEFCDRHPRAFVGSAGTV